MGNLIMSSVTRNLSHNERGAVEPKAQDDSLFMLWNSNLTLLYIHFSLFIFLCVYSVLYKVSRSTDIE